MVKTDEVAFPDKFLKLMPCEAIKTVQGESNFEILYIVRTLVNQFRIAVSDEVEYCKYESIERILTV